MKYITKEVLNSWFGLLKQLKYGYHMEPSDKKELIRLNHLIMEQANKIHNDNMLNIINSK